MAVVKLPRVAFVSHWSSQGGAERYLYDALVCLKQEGFDPISFFPRMGSLVGEVQSLGIETHIVPYKWWAGKGVGRSRRLVRNAWTVLCLPKMIWVLLSRGCDIVYTNTSMIWIGAVAARLLGIPHVWHMHEFPWISFEFEWDVGERATFRLMKRLSHRVIFNSNTTRQMFESKDPGWDGTVFYQGIRCPSPAARSERQRGAVLNVGVVGYITGQKRQADVVDAVAHSWQLQEAIRVHFLGNEDRVYVGEVQERIAAKGLGDCFKFCGYSADVWSFYAEMDFIIIPSFTESFGRVTAEAMYSGIPVIAAAGGANLELIEDGVTGYLYRAGDACDLARVLTEVISAPESAREIAVEARAAAVSRFSLDRMTRDLRELLLDLDQQGR